MKKEFRTKLVSILLTLAMVSLMVVPFGAVAASADGYAYEPDNWDEKSVSLSSAVASVGSTVDLVLSASDFTSATDLTIIISFDSTKLSIEGATDGALTITKSVSNGVIATLKCTVARGVEEGTLIPVTVACRDASVTTVNGSIRATAPDVEPGDVDASGVINNIDLVLLAQYLANYDSETGLSSVEVSDAGADINGDSVISNVDLAALAQYLATH